MPQTQPSGDEYDVVVVGSGAAGMAAALAAHQRGLRTVVVEKAAHFGGSTARSGGGVWIPNNEVLRRDGVEDTPRRRATYLHSIVGDVVPAERIDTYLDRGPGGDVLRARELAAAHAVGAGLLRLLPRGAGWPASAAGRSSPSPSTCGGSAPERERTSSPTTASRR